MPKAKHEKLECDDPNCAGTCNRCNLFICKVCGLAEGELATDCPGVDSREHGDAVYNRREDFVDGEWVRK